MPDTRCWALPTQRTWRGNPRAGGVPCLSARTGHGPRVVRRASSLIQWRPSHGGPLWRAKQWWQTRKHRHMLAHPCRSGEPVTLVIEEERFFGWVASRPPAHSLACVAIEFKRGSQQGPGTHSGGKYPAAQRLFTSASGITPAAGARSAVAARVTAVVGETDGAPWRAVWRVSIRAEAARVEARIPPRRGRREAPGLTLRCGS